MIFDDFSWDSLSHLCVCFQRSISENSLVAMDFSGHKSRVIENPSEVLSVAVEEGLSWRVTPRTQNTQCILDCDSVVHRRGHEIRNQIWHIRGLCTIKASWKFPSSKHLPHYKQRIYSVKLKNDSFGYSGICDITRVNTFAYDYLKSNTLMNSNASSHSRPYRCVQQMHHKP